MVNDDFVDQLSQEALSCMADSFFGARKCMEDEVEQMLRIAAELKPLEHRGLGWAAQLHALFLHDPYDIKQFYEHIGADPGDLVELADKEIYKPQAQKPFSFTSKGRYLKTVEQVYRDMREAVHDYLHGHYYTDPDQPGRKLLSMNYTSMMNWVHDINERIEALNASQSPADVLGFAKRLDPMAEERERITGGGIDNYAESLNKNLGLEKVDPARLELTPLPELPELDDVRDKVRDFARHFYECNTEGSCQALANVTAPR